MGKHKMRDDKGRFVKGHKLVNSRLSTGRFANSTDVDKETEAQRCFVLASWAALAGRHNQKPRGFNPALDEVEVQLGEEYS